MAEEDIDALRTVYDEWSEGNFRPVSDAYGPDLEWGFSDEFLDLGGVEREPEPTSDRMLAFLSQWDDWRCEAEEFIPAGESVVVLCRYMGRGKGSGVGIDTRGAHVWRISNGRATRLEVFSDRAKALESAGVRQGDS
jgi:ketosteroid isomerase-like protein